MTTAATFYEWAQFIGALLAVAVAGLVAFMPYARRPKLRIEEERDRVNSRVESSELGGLPHVRVLVANTKRRRAAQGARVLVEGYTPLAAHDAQLTTFGHPSLEWPTAPDAIAGAVTVFAGAARPITLGYFVRVRHDEEGVLHYVAERDYQSGEAADAWYLRLTIGLDIKDNRDKLPPVEDGYSIKLLVGAYDGAARRFKVHINWNGDPSLTAQAVLASALEKLAVT